MLIQLNWAEMMQIVPAGNGFDRFRVTINGNGKITINPADVWAINAVKVNRNITSDKNSNDEDD